MENDFDRLGSEDLVNEFTWSKSRDNQFNACRRDYYFNYYGFWGGWNLMAKRPKRELYTMKKLTSRSLLIGKDVHETIEWIIHRAKKLNSPVRIQDALNKLRYDMLTNWLFSMKHFYFTWPNITPGLTEHYYLQELDIDTFEEDYSQAETCIKNLYSMEIYQRLVKDQSIQITVEKKDSMKVSGVTVWVQPDLIAHYKSGEIGLIDWKTGKGADYDGDGLQLGIYSMYAKEKWHLAVEKIRVHELNLYQDQKKEFMIDEGEIGRTLNYIHKSIFEMQNLLAQPDRNTPYAEHYFSMKDTGACDQCKFRGRCHNDSHATAENIRVSRHVNEFEQEYIKAESVLGSNISL